MKNKSERLVYANDSSTEGQETAWAWLYRTRHGVHHEYTGPHQWLV